MNALPNPTAELQQFEALGRLRLWDEILRLVRYLRRDSLCDVIGNSETRNGF
jgi:hypothetical protein